jgi:hypothetical protein
MMPVTLPATWADDLLHDAALLAAILANTPLPEAMQATREIALHKSRRLGSVRWMSATPLTAA